MTILLRSNSDLFASQVHCRFFSLQEPRTERLGPASGRSTTSLDGAAGIDEPVRRRAARRCSKCSLEADASLAATELFHIDVFRHQEIAVGKSRCTEGIEKELAHVARWQG